MPRHLTSNAIFIKRFEQEYTAAQALNHPNIVKAIEFGRDAGTPFLVMEFVDGQSLGQKLETSHRFPETEAIRIMGFVAQGLHKAHKLGLIHRDVKPDNILLTPDGQVKLVDLGLVKEVDADLNLTRTNRGLGTPHFMAPEQFRNAKNADARCDIYSMAATLYMMVTGELPFKALGPLDAWMKKINNEITAPRELVPDLSERVDWAIRRSMSADPTQRAASCREFIEDLTGHSTRKLADAQPAGRRCDGPLVFGLPRRTRRDAHRQRDHERHPPLAQRATPRRCQQCARQPGQGRAFRSAQKSSGVPRLGHRAGTDAGRQRQTDVDVEGRGACLSDGNAALYPGTRIG